MKRILLSILIGLVLFVTYMAVASVIFVISKYDVSILPYLNFPVRLPQIIFYYFSPPTAEDYQMNTFTGRKLLLGIASVIINVFLYSVIAYFILGFISKFRKPKLIQIELPPPPPPSFN